VCIDACGVLYNVFNIPFYLKTPPGLIEVTEVIDVTVMMDDTVLI
jgi:hypothetical protein